MKAGEKKKGSSAGLTPRGLPQTVIAEQENIKVNKARSPECGCISTCILLGLFVFSPLQYVYVQFHKGSFRDS